MEPLPKTKPWDFSRVQQLINEVPPTLELQRDSPSRSVETPPPPASSSLPMRYGIGDLTPVYALLDSYNTEAPTFRELERLPPPSWKSRAEFLDRDAYASDGAASSRVYHKWKPLRSTLWESSDDEKVIDSLGSDSDVKEVMTPKTARKAKKKKAKKQIPATRQAVSDGEAIKPQLKILRRAMPAAKAANHHVTSSSMQAMTIESHTTVQQNIFTKAVKFESPHATPAVATITPGVDNSGRLTQRRRSKSATDITSITPTKQRASALSTSLVDSWIQRDRVERDLAFRLQLIQSFPEDRLSLSKTVAFKQGTGINSIHVFIDFSNIWIGYMVHLQRLMGLPKTSRLKPQQRNLSFESLVFLLERGRSTEKRILAGSWPWLPAFDTAKAIGYDSNILEKVLKNRALTDEQRRTQHVTYRKSAEFSSQTVESQNITSTSATFQQSTGSGMMTPSKVPLKSQTQNTSIFSSSPEKWVEQGVDELLQLKISHSLLDYNTPSTIVLATGDGAEAEYSDGFAAMIERVMNRGWKVELVSWKHCVNSIYSKRSWLERWPAGQFRFIALEPFAEYLLECAQE
jgi:hypothetical protein